MSEQTPSVARLSVLLFLGMVTFAFAPILVRFAGDVNPVTLAVIRTVSAAVLLAPFWLFKRREGIFPAWSPAEQWKAWAAGGFLALHFICWIASLSYTSVASASVLVTIHPVILIVAESAMRSNKFRGITWVGVFVAFAGSCLLALIDTEAADTYSNPVFGNMLALAAAFLFVGYLLLGQSLRRKARWLDFVFRVYTGTAIASLIIFFVLGLSFEAAPIAILCGIGLAVGPQILGHGSVNYSVKYVSPTLLSTLILTEPVFAILLAVFLFQEIPSMPEIISMSVILCGIALTWMGGIRKKV